MNNPVYTGTFIWGGKTYLGKYEPLIIEALSREVQDLLHGRTRRGQRRTYAYTGLVRCQTCKGLLTGDLKSGRYVYYACRASKGCTHFYLKGRSRRQPARDPKPRHRRGRQ